MSNRNATGYGAERAEEPFEDEYAKVPPISSAQAPEKETKRNQDRVKGQCPQALLRLSKTTVSPGQFQSIPIGEGP